MFVYLMTREVPDDFRVFLHRHRELLSTLFEWSIRILVPQRFHKAAALYQHAVRDEFMTPVRPVDAEALACLFGGDAVPQRHRPTRCRTPRKRCSATGACVCERSDALGSRRGTRPSGPRNRTRYATICRPAAGGWNSSR